MGDSPEIAIMKGNKEAFIQMIKDNYKTKTEKFYKDFSYFSSSSGRLL
jgi:polyphosphate kinase